MRKTCLWLVGVLLLSVYGAGVCDAQVSVGSRRLIHFFDFEERASNNFEQMPRYWYETGRDAQTAVQSFMMQPLHREMTGRMGYPIFNELGFDQTHQLSGEYSLGMKVKDGDVGMFLEVGAIPVVPNSDYLMTFHVKTEALHRANARVRVYFVDTKGERIGESVVASEAIRTQGEWTLVKLKLLGNYDRAAYLGMELDIEQPTDQVDHPLGKRQIVLEDIEGGAWFDDIGVWQVPHIQVKTQSEVNVVNWPERPRLDLQIRDLTGHRLLADVKVYDYRLEEVASQRRVVGGGMPKSWTWEPGLKEFGWYLVDMRIYEQKFYRSNRESVPVAWTRSAFLWTPELRNAVGAEGRRFAIINDDADSHQLGLISKMLLRVGVKVLTLNVWDEETSPDGIVARYKQIEQIASDVYRSGGQLVLSLDPLPKLLSQSEELDAKQSLVMFQREEALWRQHIAPMMMRLGQRISNWQIGYSEDPDAFYFDKLDEKVSGARSRLRSMVPTPDLMLPWELNQARPMDVDDKEDVTYLLRASEGIAPNELGAYLEEWQTDRPPFWVYFPSLDASRYRHVDRVSDLVKRMLYAWREDPNVLAIRRPWTRAAERRNAVLPDPILGAFSQLGQLLAERQVVEELPLERGLKGLVLDGRQGGMLAVWDDLADGRERELSMYLGESPVLVDVWGNRTSLELKGGKHHIKLSKVPVFVEGIDTKLAMFRASFKLSEPFIESKQMMHERKILLKNPWNRTISGYLQVKGPERWKMEPVRQFFSIPAGQKNSLSIKLRFPLSETSGDKQLVARFKFTADMDYQIDMGTPMELGLEGIDFSATLSLRPGLQEGATDAVLVCLISNRSLDEVTLYSFASIQGKRRQEVPVPKLMPGETVMRRFYFEDVEEALKKFSVRVGVREVDGPAVLNQKITYGTYE
ncbi:hypothetical protein KS4_21040 [Poriferisphaera corsica]|uniref:Uncharacterized protein n=1 Tax=Poriferisphaera corsica TaxID=2528020 RepID=A0A517YV55_9BACT|nr:hypothetical protein [Poriferisphaera corsica]QDU34042.1 hypothetical protein KS4_21040 [Poriferisphaera corsica]